VLEMFLKHFTKEEQKKYSKHCHSYFHHVKALLTNRSIIAEQKLYTSRLLIWNLYTV